MSFKTDAGGLALRLNDAKLMTTETCSTWNTRLSQIGKSGSQVIICTYSLPDVDYICRILDKRSRNVTLIVNDKFRSRAEELKRRYPALKIHTRPDVHAKIVLIEPETVWLSSANFGKSGWFENTIGIHSKAAYDFYLDQIQRYLSG